MPPFKLSLRHIWKSHTFNHRLQEFRFICVGNFCIACKIIKCLLYKSFAIVCEELASPGVDWPDMFLACCVYHVLSLLQNLSGIFTSVINIVSIAGTWLPSNPLGQVFKMLDLDLIELIIGYRCYSMFSSFKWHGKYIGNTGWPACPIFPYLFVPEP